MFSLTFKLLVVTVCPLQVNVIGVSLCSNTDNTSLFKGLVVIPFAKNPPSGTFSVVPSL